MVAVREQPAEDWDEFVATRPEASLYHRCGWSLLAREAFNHHACFLEKRDDAGKIIGVLPLVRQKHFLLGNFATSVPFFNSGGALATSDAVALDLMLRAKQLAQEWKCSYVEFRDERPRPGEWIVRTDKVSMVLQLPSTKEDLARQLGSKLRSQIKRADRENPVVRVGRRELLEDFYEVFCRNMRDLGTPTYPRRFFEKILTRFPQQSLLVTVERNAIPVAAAFLLIDGQRAEIPWACCREDARSQGFNMKLYWEVLATTIQYGCAQFDFGRSTADSGTYRFKKQWGAKPVQLYWHRWQRAPVREGRATQAAAKFWKRMPLPVANFLGPLISPALPW